MKLEQKVETLIRSRAIDDPSSPLTWSKCFAVPGADHIIDLVHPITGRSQIYGKTLAQVQEQYPDAVTVDFDAHCAEHAARQDAGGEWIETTEARFHEMLEALPPAATVPGYAAFMVGEASDHHARTGQPRFAAFKCEGGKYWNFTRPMTFREFNQVVGDCASYHYS